MNLSSTGRALRRMTRGAQLLARPQGDRPPHTFDFDHLIGNDLTPEQHRQIALAAPAGTPIRRLKRPIA